MIAAIVLFVLLGLIISIFLLSAILSRRSFARRFVVRSRSDPISQLVSFGADAMMLVDFLNRIESLLGIPKGTLRLDDRFLVELSPDKRWAIYNPSGDILDDVSRYWPDDAKKIVTVRDFLSFVLQWIRNGATKGEIIKKVL